MSQQPPRESSGAARAAHAGHAEMRTDVMIMGQTYTLACPPGHESRLAAAVERVNGAMCQIRGSGKLHARERIAVLAALNLAFDALQAPEGSAENAPESAPEAPASAPGAPPACDEAALSALLLRLDAALDADESLDS